MGKGYLGSRLPKPSQAIPALLRPGKFVPSGPAVACWVFDRFHVGFPYRLDREISLQAKGEEVCYLPPPAPFRPLAWTEPPSQP